MLQEEEVAAPSAGMLHLPVRSSGKPALTLFDGIFSKLAPRVLDKNFPLCYHLRGKLAINPFDC